jgi:chloride channel 3/4/5
MYQVSYSRDWRFFEFIFFIILGVFGGLSGAFLIHASIWFEKRKKDSWWWLINPIVQVILVALVTAVVSYFNVYTRVDSSELLESLFRECSESNFKGICEY